MGSGQLKDENEHEAHRDRRERRHKRRWDAQAGFDREAALGRLADHPEVMPPHPEPYRAHKREAWGLRVPTLIGMVAAGLLVPVLIALARR